jgi:hypothetical protein
MSYCAVMMNENYFHVKKERNFIHNFSEAFILQNRKKIKLRSLEWYFTSLPRKKVVFEKATNVSMDVNDNDERNGNVICDGGKIFKMRHQMACAILGICKTHISGERDVKFWNRKETLHYTQMHRPVHTFIALFSGKRATLLVMHAPKAGHLKIFFALHLINWKIIFLKRLHML